MPGAKDDFKTVIIAQIWDRGVTARDLALQDGKCDCIASLLGLTISMLRTIYVVVNVWLKKMS